MALTSDQVRVLVADRQRAVATLRESDDPETQARAYDAGEDIRRQLDEHLLSLTEAREAAVAAEVDEARERASAFINGDRAATVAEETTAIGEFLDPDNSRKSFRLNLETRANEEWWKDTGSTVKAGYMVPTTVLDRVVYHVNATSGVFDSAYKLPTATGEDIQVPVLTTDATALLTAEKTAATITNPVFGAETLKSYRLDGYFTLSNELLRDAATNVPRLVGDAAGRAIATLLASYLTTGTGSGEPEGVTIGSTAGVTAASDSAIALDEIIELYYSVLPGARKAGTWVVSSDAMYALATMKDGDGNYLFSPAVAAGQPDTLLGKPIYEDAAMPAIAASAKPIVFGDLADYYWIRIVDRGTNGGILVEMDGSVSFTSFMTVCRFAMWVDARVMGTGGEIKHLVMHA